MFKPPLPAQYTAAFGSPTRPPCELMLTMRPPRPGHCACRRLAHEEGAAQIDRHHLVPVGFGDVKSGAREAKTRIVDEDIDAVVGGQNPGDGFVDRGHVAQLRMPRQAPRPGLRSDRRGVGVRAHSWNNDGSCLGEQDRQLAPDALRRPRDDDDTITKIEATRRGAKRRHRLVFAIRHVSLSFRAATIARQADLFGWINPAQRVELRVRGPRRRSRTGP